MGKLLKVFIVTFIIMMLAGCLNVEIKYNLDGSGEVKYIFEKKGMNFSNGGKSILSQIDEINKKAGSEVVSLKKVTEKEECTEITVSFKKISLWFEDNSMFFGTWNDFVKQCPDEIKEVQNAKGNPVNLGELNKEQGLQIAFQKNRSISKAKITVPGVILFISPGAQINGINSVELANGSGFVIFKNSQFNVVQDFNNSGLLGYGVFGAIGLGGLIALILLFKVIKTILKGAFSKKGPKKVKKPAANKTDRIEL